MEETKDEVELYYKEFYSDSECSNLVNSIDFDPTKFIENEKTLIYNPKMLIKPDDMKGKKHLTILIMGKMGVGKSTLINEICGQEIFKSLGNSPKGVTMGLQSVLIKEKHEDPEWTIRLIDSEGMGEGNIDRIKSYIFQVASGFFIKHFNLPSVDCIWYVQKDTDKRIDDHSRSVLKEIILSMGRCGLGIPIKFVVSFNSEKNYELNSSLDNWNINFKEDPFTKDLLDNIFVLKEYVDISHKEKLKIEYFEQIDHIKLNFNKSVVELLKISYTVQSFNEGENDIKRELSDITIIKEANKKLGLTLIPISIASVSAGIIGASPIPFSDVILIAPIQLAMAISILAIYKIKAERSVIVSTLSSIGGLTGLAYGARLLANFLKFVPGLNIPAMIIDSLISIVFVVAIGFAFTLVIRHTIIKTKSFHVDISTDLFKKELFECFKDIYPKIKRNRDKFVMELFKTYNIEEDIEKEFYKSFGMLNHLVSKSKKNNLEKRKNICSYDPLKTCLVCLLKVKDDNYSLACGCSLFCKSCFKENSHRVNACPVCHYIFHHNSSTEFFKKEDEDYERMLNERGSNKMELFYNQEFSLISLGDQDYLLNKDDVDC
eukprot:TRINITY_DN3613_c0_g1_i2.p1 TRINITY_DN3613_c0_g1~~TRINITY_DN3613_c0_g1_i2.p1  ORF type:complete len:632 (-),score=138.27 TRINITY_DN3613_c0_g1_i2:13-1821(-)